jgi:ribose transport system permease protein
MSTIAPTDNADARPAARVIPNRPSRLSEISSWPGTRALISVIGLFAVSWVIASSSVTGQSVVAMLPFAALIAVVAIGQTLVVMQGGLDLSVGGAISLSALIAAKYGAPDSLGVIGAIVLALVVATAFGLLNGLIVSLFGLPPLVVTIASGALMVGAVQAISGGFNAQSDDALSQFAISRLAGIPMLAIIVFAVVLVLQAILKLTRVGRKFELVGENRRSAVNIGIPTRSYVTAAYVLSGLLAGVCGVLLAGYLRAPTLNAGDAYLLASVAAVVLGGTALTGGRGTLIGTALGALFLGQLNQLVQTFTQSVAAQNLIQALIIGVGIVAQVQLGGTRARMRRWTRRTAHDEDDST